MKYLIIAVTCMNLIACGDKSKIEINKQVVCLEMEQELEIIYEKAKPQDALEAENEFQEACGGILGKENTTK